MYFYPLNARRIFHTEITPSDWFKAPVFIDVERHNPFFGKVLSEEIFRKITRESQLRDFSWSQIERIVEEHGLYEGVDFTGTVLQMARFKNCFFKNCKFWNTDLQNADFADCMFSNCTFGACHTEGSFFRRSSFLRGTSFLGFINPSILEQMTTFIGPARQ